jgi:hypothetical protein
MQRLILTLLIVMIVQVLSIEVARAEATVFEDIQGHWAQDAIEHLAL